MSAPPSPARAAAASEPRRRPGNPHRARARGSDILRDDLFAALDLGTNSCRMLIARPKGQEFEVIDAFSKAVHLGEGLEYSGAISHQAIYRTINALRVCRRKLETHGVKSSRLVATEACRRALNGRKFLRQIRKETGLLLELIRPEEEAQLAVISCAPHVHPQTDQLLIIDIGGGSTELVWLDLSDVPPEQRKAAVMRFRIGKALARRQTGQRLLGRLRLIDWISVPFGVATLNQHYADVLDECAKFALMSCLFEEGMAGFLPYIEAETLLARGRFQIIGTSGTVTTVAASHLGLMRYDRQKVDGLTMSADEINVVIERYLRMGEAQRRQDRTLAADRHELILSGSAILQTILRLWPTDYLSVADRGLREGLIYAQMIRAGVLRAE